MSYQASTGNLGRPNLRIADESLLKIHDGSSLMNGKGADFKSTFNHSYANLDSYAM
jgi:hypothetical protein